MKWIIAEQQVTVNLYNEEHEEYFDETMTVEEMLDAYTNEGCPTMYINPERKGKWILVTDNYGQHFICEHCGEWRYHQNQKFCGECGAKLEEGEQDA